MLTDMAVPTFHYELDVASVADYLISLDELRPEPDVTPLKLAKLLYLAQANYLASTGRRVFDEDVEAFEHGPIVYREWKRHPGHQIIAASDRRVTHDRPPVPDDVADFLDQLWSRYKDKSAAELRRLTHEQAPWRDHYRGDGFRIVIPDDDMTTYFRRDVPRAERVFHSAVVVVPAELLDDEGAEEFATAVASYSGP